MNYVRTMYYVLAVDGLGYPLESLQCSAYHCAYAAAFAIPALDRLDVCLVCEPLGMPTHARSTTGRLLQRMRI